MGNLLIVESKNDKIFIEKLIQIMNLSNVTVDEPICIDEYSCLPGLSETALTEAFEDLLDDLRRQAISKVGVIIDIDKKTEQERLDFVNSCIVEAFQKSVPLEKVNELIDVMTSNNISFQLGCHFMNVDGQGELETVLKAIKTKDSPYADCLESWRECLKNNKKSIPGLNQKSLLNPDWEPISKKDFDKFWLSNYVRFDTCSKRERGAAKDKCSMEAFEYILEHKSDIFKWDDPILEDLKEFLKLFAEN